MQYPLKFYADNLANRGHQVKWKVLHGGKLAHVERIVLEQFLKSVDQADSKLSKILKRLCDLFALSRIEKDKGWFLENGYIEGNKAKAIRNQIDQLCTELKDDAVNPGQCFWHSR